MAKNHATYIKAGILKEKISNMQSQLKNVFTQEDSTFCEPSALDRELQSKLSLQQMEQEDESAVERNIKLGLDIDTTAAIAEFLINSKIMDYAKKSLQELGVEVVQMESGVIVFVDKETNAPIYKTNEK